MNVVDVPFARENVAPIVSSEKWLTARLGWDVQLERGDVLELQDEDRDRHVGSALASWQIDTTAQAFVDARMAGHRVYDDVDEFGDHMARYYDRDVYRSTPVSVLAWDPDCLLVNQEHPLVARRALP